MRNKPYCNAPWVGLAYEGTMGCKPCCEYQGTLEKSATLGVFSGRYTDYIKSDN